MPTPIDVPDRIRKTAQTIVARMRYDAAQEASVISSEEFVDSHMRRLVEDLSTLLARDTAFRWEERAASIHDDLLQTTKDLAEARKLLAEAQAMLLSKT